MIYNYADEAVVRQWDVTTLPLRCAKFIARKGWVIVGADDMTIRIYNYNTGDMLKRFEAHQVLTTINEKRSREEWES